MKMYTRTKRATYCRDFLDANLFHLHEVLSKSLLDVRKNCVRLSNMRFFRTTGRSDTQTLEKFFNVQHTRVEEVSDTMREIVGTVKQLVLEGCENFMTAANKTMEMQEQRCVRVRVRVHVCIVLRYTWHRSPRILRIIRQVMCRVSAALHGSWLSYRVVLLACLLAIVERRMKIDLDSEHREGDQAHCQLRSPR